MVSPLVIFVFGLLAGAWAEECKDDAVTCLQMDMYRGAKSLLEKDIIDVWGGIKVVRTKPSSVRSGRALENKILHAKDSDEREDALEEYAVNGVEDFVQGRSIQWDLAPVARDATSLYTTLSSFVPEALQQQIKSFFSDEEGRGKKKKLLKALLPLFLGLKMKMAGFLVLSYFVIALIAKKALLAAVVSLAIAGFLAIKKLMSQGHHGGHQDIGWAAAAQPSFGYSAGASGWDAYGGAGHDVHGAYTSNVAHSLAYGGQKPAVAAAR